MNTQPKWFSHPNSVLTEQDILEQIEYEKQCLNQAKWDFSQALTADSRERAWMDVVNTELRIASLEDKVGV